MLKKQLEMEHAQQKQTIAQLKGDLDILRRRCSDQDSQLNALRDADKELEACHKILNAAGETFGCTEERKPYKLFSETTVDRPPMSQRLAFYVGKHYRSPLFIQQAGRAERAPTDARAKRGDCQC